MKNIGIAVASLALLFAASTAPSMASDVGIHQPSQGSDINNQYQPDYQNAVRNYNQPVEQADAQQTSVSWNMEQYNSFQDTQAMDRYRVDPLAYADGSAPVVDQTIVTTTTLPANNMVAIQDVGSLTPFSLQCNYMSQPGFVRYLVFDQRGVWVTRADAVALVTNHGATGD